MNPKRLHQLMIQAGYASPHLASRAHVLANLIIEELTSEKRVVIQLVDILHSLGYSGPEAEDLWRGL